jgi:DNA helicase HerA-like ATPase
VPLEPHRRQADRRPRRRLRPLVRARPVRLLEGQAIKFAADFLERLYDRKARARSTTLLVMDEAHFYAPQTPRGGFKGDSRG